MLKDITLGQYYQTDSIIHRLDPRVKLATTLAFIISLFVFDNVAGYAIAAIFLVIVIKLSKVPFKFMVKGMKAIVFLILLTVICNLLLTPGEPLVTLWKLTITKEGLRIAALMTVRLSFLIIGSSIMTLTTTPNQLTDAMEKMMSPLKKIKVPVHEIAMMMTIALRFIPTLIEETDKIMSAQKARGADIESGGLIKRVKALVPILIPLLISSFRRASELADAMECRCYHGGDGRTRMKIMKASLADYLSVAVFALLLAAIILCNTYCQGIIYSLIKGHIL